jgi:hypothetical protein
MNEIENTKQIRYAILILIEMFITLTQDSQEIKTTIKFYIENIWFVFDKIRVYQFMHAFHTFFHGCQPLIHETAGLFPVNSEIHRKIYCKIAKYIFSK